MKRFSFCLAGFFIGAARYSLLLILALVLVIIGLLTVDLLTYVGLGVLGLYLVLCLVNAFRMGRMTALMERLTHAQTDDPEVNALLEQLGQDPAEFLQTIAQGNEHTQLHGEDLLALSDEDLFGAVYEQNLDICDEAEETEDEVSLFHGARRTVFVLNRFDMEVQNGGLCQFFVNSSRCAAPYVSDALAEIGAEEHRKLFDDFIRTNHIDVNDLASFRVSSVRGFKRQSKRFDFDAFDDRYYELDSLEAPITNYIRAHIAEF